jgi:hypothetical protein
MGEHLPLELTFDVRARRGCGQEELGRLGRVLRHRSMVEVLESQYLGGSCEKFNKRMRPRGGAAFKNIACRCEHPATVYQNQRRTR